MQVRLNLELPSREKVRPEVLPGATFPRILRPWKGARKPVDSIDDDHHAGAGIYPGGGSFDPAGDSINRDEPHRMQLRTTGLILIVSGQLLLVGHADPRV